ncbi:hypothetical protein JL101_014055 [Skermanella rosea]|uniref:hypothetical protein n=1 Tax=Skermanella rosea TaxID=1817965 RepID=UPI001934504C|nr:hypothetical protein [Skermanella rosea]UEM06507.1 hypothetical protein JL101_014055 [Skermanella rosea]
MGDYDLNGTHVASAVAMCLFILLLKTTLDPKRSLRQALFLPPGRSRWHRLYWRLSPLLFVAMAALAAVSYLPPAGDAAGWLRLVSLGLLVPLMALAAAAESETGA